MEQVLQTFGGRFVLLLAVILTGAVIAVLSTWALMKQKVTVNEKGQVTEVEVPIFGKLKTTYPAVVTAFLGVALCAYGATHLPSDGVVKKREFGALPAKIQPDPSGSVMQYIVTVAEKSQWFPVSPGFQEPMDIHVPVEFGRDYNLIVAKMLPEPDENGAPRYLMSITPVGILEPQKASDVTK